MVHESGKKQRNYSFARSRRLPVEKMTEVNGIKIPSMPGSCYHAIISALATHKNKFCGWEKIIDLTEKCIRQYGGNAAWDKFVAKSGVKGYKQRVKDNTHTLTRTGKDCYGYRLHERGMAIYFFKDGAILFTNGFMHQEGNDYTVIFTDGRQLQRRYRGTTMTYAEYKRFLDDGYIDINGGLLKPDAIRESRSGLIPDLDEVELPLVEEQNENVQVCVTLVETYDQGTANRLDEIGFIVEQALENELIGSIPKENLSKLQNDNDVIDVVVMGE